VVEDRDLAESARIRVFLVEDHPVFAEGLAALLAGQEDMTVVGIARSVAEAMIEIPRADANVLIVDFRLPDGNGADLVNALPAGSQRATIFLSGDDSDASLMAALEAGAYGYLVKTHAAPQVIDAVRRAARGETLLDAATLRALMQHRADAGRQAAERSAMLTALTVREQQVLALMSSGLSNREIAEALVIEYSTVRHHVGNVVAKLGAHTKLEAVARATRLHLVPG